MKKYITAALLFCAALTAACSKETAGSIDAGDHGGARNAGFGHAGRGRRGIRPLAASCRTHLPRQQRALAPNTPGRRSPRGGILLAGEYRVEARRGRAVPASFSKRLYKGEKTFTVAAGQTTVAEVECKRQNVVAEVKFDATVSAAFGENFHAWVVAADSFDEGQVQQGGVPALNYTADGTGYFTMPRV